MASRASSEARGPHGGTGIPALPGLGTGWYRRGAGYWLRRTVTGVLWVALMAVLYVCALAMYSGFFDEIPDTARTVLNAVLAIASCAALVWGWTAQRRRHREALLDPPTPEQAWEAKRRRAGRNVGLTFGRRGAVILLVPVVPAVVAYAAGEVLGVVTVRESAAEVGARQWLAKVSTARSAGR